MRLIERTAIPFHLKTLMAIVMDRSRAMRRFVREIGSSVQVEAITYRSDGLRVKGYLAYPKRRGRYPCLIYCRGGNREFSKLTDRGVWLNMGRMASWGYVVIGSQYRGNAGSEGKEAFGGRDVHDVLNLIPCLRELPCADPQRIGMYGWSRGGLMIYRALTVTQRIRAAVVGGGQADLLGDRTRRPEMFDLYRQLIPGKGARFSRELRRRSASYWPEKIHRRTALLLLHGTSDWRVSADKSLRLAEKLLALRHPFRLVLFEGADHAISEFRREVWRLTRDWFDRFVRDREPLPKMAPHGD